MGALTENHRSPRGRFSRLTDALSAVGIGSVLGVLVCFAVVSDPAGALVLASAAPGAVLVRAAREAMGPRL